MNDISIDFSKNIGTIRPDPSKMGAHLRGNHSPLQRGLGEWLPL